MLNSAVYSAHLPRVLGMLLQSFSRIHTVYHRFRKIFVAWDIKVSFISPLLSVYIAFLFHLFTIYCPYKTFASRMFPVYGNELKHHDHSAFVGLMFSACPPSIWRVGAVYLSINTESKVLELSKLYSLFSAPSSPVHALCRPCIYILLSVYAV